MEENTDYTPFGKEWESYLMRLPKKGIIELYKNTCIKLNETEEQLRLGDVVGTFFCGVEGGLCYYETKDRGCKANFNCKNKIAK